MGPDDGFLVERQSVNFRLVDAVVSYTSTDDDD